MGKLSIARSLADELGIALSKAQKFVDDVGGARAQRVIDNLQGAGDETLGRFINPTTLTVAGIAGGGYLLWRQQDVAKARALAEQASTYNEMVSSIAESDLPPELKRELIDDANEQAEKRRNNDGGDGSWIDDLTGDPMMMVFALVIVVVVLQQVLKGGGN